MLSLESCLCVGLKILPLCIVCPVHRWHQTNDPALYLLYFQGLGMQKKFCSVSWCTAMKHCSVMPTHMQSCQGSCGDIINAACRSFSIETRSKDWQHFSCVYLVRSKRLWRSQLSFVSTQLIMIHSSITATSSLNLPWKALDILIALHWCCWRAVCSKLCSSWRLAFFPSRVIRFLMMRKGNHTLQWPCLLVASACISMQPCMGVKLMA